MLDCLAQWGHTASSFPPASDEAGFLRALIQDLEAALHGHGRHAQTVCLSSAAALLCLGEETIRKAAVSGDIPAVAEEHGWRFCPWRLLQLAERGLPAPSPEYLPAHAVDLTLWVIEKRQKELETLDLRSLLRLCRSLLEEFNLAADEALCHRPILTVSEFADHAGSSETSVRRRIRAAQVPSIRVGGTVRILATAA